MTVGAKVGAGRRADVFEWGDEPDGRPTVLKLFNEGAPPASVERELAFSRAASDAGVPTPKVYGDVVERGGRLGIVYERVDGPSLTRLLSTRLLRSVARDLAELHIKVHGAKVSGLQTEKEHLKRKIAHAPTITGDEKSHLIAQTDSMPDGDRLCHGDFHPYNVIFRTPEDGGPVIIDWENAGVGDPLADVAQTSLLAMFGWRGSPNMLARWLVRWALGRIHRFYFPRYFELSGLDAAGVERWMTVLAAARIADRIPEEHDPLVRYVRERLAAGL